MFYNVRSEYYLKTHKIEENKKQLEKFIKKIKFRPSSFIILIKSTALYTQLNKLLHTCRDQENKQTLKLNTLKATIPKSGCL